MCILEDPNSTYPSILVQFFEEEPQPEMHVLEVLIATKPNSSPWHHTLGCDSASHMDSGESKLFPSQCNTVVPSIMECHSSITGLGGAQGK